MKGVVPPPPPVDKVTAPKRPSIIRNSFPTSWVIISILAVLLAIVTPCLLFLKCEQKSQNSKLGLAIINLVTRWKGGQKNTVTTTSHSLDSKFIPSPPLNYSGKLSLIAAGYCIKKTTSSSSHECGEDAFSIHISTRGPSGGRTFLGVADGVGGWSESGGDSSKISIGLLEEIRTLVNSTRLALGEAASLAFSKMSAQSIHKQGSTTLCAAMLDHEKGQLDISNVGDSGAFIIRNGQIVFKTKAGVEGFNAPHQVGFDHLGRPYGSIALMETKYSTALIPGDIIIMVTDGVLDNLYDQEILELVLTILNPIIITTTNENDNGGKLKLSTGVSTDLALQERVRSAAITLAWHSWSRSQESHWRSPFAESAIKHGYSFSGGKQDDITVVMAVVRS